MVSLQEFVSGLHFGEAVAFENLIMIPVMAQDARPEPGYLMFWEAIEANLARVTELGGGTVPELLFENMADCPVLLLGGEELVGAKQNRMLNLTILAAPHSKIVIPVSCVEAGRWHQETIEFRASLFMAFSSVRARSTARVTESMRVHRRRRADQGEVWDEIAVRSKELGARSATGAMRAIYEKNLSDVEQFAQSMPHRPGQIGAAFLIDGDLAGMDVLDHPRTMEKMIGILVRGYALDAMAAQRAGGNVEKQSGPDKATGQDAKAVAEKVRQWLADLDEGRLLIEPAVGMGQDVRFENQRVTAAALWAEERFVHFCVFPQAGSADPDREPQWGRPNSHRWRRRTRGGNRTEGPMPDADF